jgi:N-acetylmuramoyl-L-alanine amidase
MDESQQGARRKGCYGPTPHARHTKSLHAHPVEASDTVRHRAATFIRKHRFKIKATRPEGVDIAESVGYCSGQMSRHTLTRRGLGYLLWFCALAFAGGAGAVTSIDNLAERAAACDQNLQQSSELRKFRANWLRCIQRFADVVAASSDGEVKRSALKRQAELAQELARRSGRQDDARTAKRLFARLAAPSPGAGQDSSSPSPVRVVIDPGHGGKDPGTVGANGVQEKEVVLDVAKRLHRLLAPRDHIEPLLTRTDDQFVSLQDRTAFAQQRGADLFVSIHVNSSPKRDTKGLEVYVLGHASDDDAGATAARENDEPGDGNNDVTSLIQSMLGDLSNSRREEQSLELADILRQSVIHKVEGRYDLVDLGIKRAPFYVLLNAGVPSILSELAFLSNTDDAARLRRPEFRQLIAEALAAGIAKYATSSVLARSN